MKRLFKNTTDITKKEIIKFNYFNLLSNKFLIVILLYMPAIWMISGIGIFIKEGNVQRLITSLILSIIWMALIFLPPYLSVKRKYKIEDYCNEYEFYEDRMIAKNKFSKEDIFYSALYKVYETKGYFYFYVNKKSVLIIKKDNAKGNIKFSAFIKEKVNKKYRKSMIL